MSTFSAHRDTTISEGADIVRPRDPPSQGPFGVRPSAPPSRVASRADAGGVASWPTDVTRPHMARRRVDVPSRRAVPLFVVPMWRYRVHRWEIRPQAVYTRTGWLVQERRIAPISRVQTVDT